ncbi:hypothetical protein K4749_19490 [Streptomyces sp. TRM72054]|uniref:hypothetical protein n=1 Tax=Streptomyces sp. TRM72054 TaxID=2870562 RepID=UPI001C8BEAA8|nr:hypothetical protein [Streptomyces sp. TRM72054]MBX9395722.1 hypothetical protein [Streptomyces sp. TRM72054]
MTTRGGQATGRGERQPTAPERARELLRSGLGLIGPRHARHSVSVDQLHALTLPIGDDGVVIGVDAENRPAVLGLNRPTPYDVVLIGGLWTAQVIALRAAATGARVAVETGRPQAWMQMVHAMGGGQNGLAVYDVGRVPPQGTSAGTPVLVVRDCGMRPPRGRVVSGPWQSVLTVLPYLSPVAPRLVRQARLVGVQRVSPDEAAELGRTMALPRTDVDALPTLPDGLTLWCTDRDRQYVMTQPTDAEIGLLGMPRRMD